MQNIEDYIQLPQATRQQHLKLGEPCIERGGMSSYCKGLLAHILDTTIPSGRLIQVCHACHNAKCSNPHHLYWGTPAENRLDAVANGAPANPYQAMVMKYGEAHARQQCIANLGDNSKAGKGNIGKPKSDEHRARIAEAMRKRHAEGRYSTTKLGRKKKLQT